MRRVVPLLVCALLAGASCSGDDASPTWGDVNNTERPADATDADPSSTRSTDAPDSNSSSDSADAPDDHTSSDSTDGRSSGLTVTLAGIDDPGPVTCPPATVEVSSAAELEDALGDADGGDVIHLADATYEGAFVATAAASDDEPFFVCGGRDAILDGGGVKAGYGFHLDGASGWRLIGFTVRNAQKGVMADGASGNIVQGLMVEHIGDEAIHLRSFSTGNVVRDNEVHDTGLRRDKFGEGIYIGSAVSNWSQHSDGKPDRSDGNLIQGNRIWDTSSESVDIKEGTSGGVLRGNSFDGAGTTAADSWVDVKGNGWLIEGNTGVASPLDGFQLHEIEDGWGTGNAFLDNTGSVDADGYGINTTNTDGNMVGCGNTLTGATEGLTDIDCS